MSKREDNLESALLWLIEAVSSYDTTISLGADDLLGDYEDWKKQADLDYAGIIKAKEKAISVMSGEDY